MGLTRLSIQRPVFVIVLMTVFLVLGLRSRGAMQIDLNPKVEDLKKNLASLYKAELSAWQ